MSKNTNKEQELRESIKVLKEKLSNAERQLAQIAPLYKNKTSSIQDGEVYFGIFDGDNMVTEEGKTFSVPPNYASKSKMVEGDYLKLIISRDGQFIFKTIRKAERHYKVGVLKQRDDGSYVVDIEGKSYSICLSSITYYQARPGDEVAVIIPADNEYATHAAMDSLVSKHNENTNQTEIKDDLCLSDIL